MANPKDNRNAETSKSMGADIGHMFMMGTYYPRDVMMRDANDGTVVHGSDHPTAGGETKQVQVGVANAVTTPVSQIYQACASDAAWQRTAGVSLDGLFVPFSATFKINSDKGSGHDANRSPGDAEYFPTFEKKEFSEKRVNRPNSDFFLTIFFNKCCFFVLAFIIDKNRIYRLKDIIIENSFLKKFVI